MDKMLTFHQSCVFLDYAKLKYLSNRELRFRKHSLAKKVDIAVFQMQQLDQSKSAILNIMDFETRIIPRTGGSIFPLHGGFNFNLILLKNR